MPAVSSEFCTWEGALEARNDESCKSLGHPWTAGSPQNSSKPWSFWFRGDGGELKF